MLSLVMPSDREHLRPSHNFESKTKTGADQEHAQGLSKGKTRTGRAVGEAEMQNIVAELTKLKRDLKQWRFDTERSTPRWLLCAALLCAALCMAK